MDIWDEMIRTNPEYSEWWKTLPINYQSGGNQESISVNHAVVSRCASFNCEQHTFTCKFKKVEKTFGEAKSELTDMFMNLHAKMLSMMNDTDYIRITFFHENFRKGGIGFPFMKKKDLEVTNLQDRFEYIANSYLTTQMNIDNSLTADIIIAHAPSGSGISRKATHSFKNQQDFFDNDYNTINVINDDNFCLIRAVLIAIAFIENEKLILNKYLYANSGLLKTNVLKIVKKCKIENKQCGIDELKKLEVYFKNYQITLINNDGRFESPIYIGIPNKKFIYISYTGSHYNVIKSMKVFSCKNYYCHYCKKGYSSRRDHHCKNLCQLCNRYNCTEESLELSTDDFLYEIDDEKFKAKATFSCEFCQKECKNEWCKLLHQNDCKKKVLCDKCNSIITRQHICSQQKYCKNCKKAVDYEHKCYILTYDEKFNSQSHSSSCNGYIFFDYEAYQIDGKHVANLIIADKLCLRCVDKLPCVSNCQMIKFYTNDDFCEWLFDKENSGFTAIAHNLQGYDGIFLMNYIKLNMISIDKHPSIIKNGTKILTLTFRNVKVIDSYAFVPISLESFPKTFGLIEMKKGFFPHLFNQPENFNYVGMFPDKKFYNSEYFSESKKKEFDEWYSKKENTVFNFEEEIESYCTSDVKLLKEGCLAFRSIIMKITDGIDPFLNCITIASLCHFIFRKMIMVPKSIGIIPLLGYNPEQNSSLKALQWIKYMSFKHGYNISHAKNGGEFKIGKYLVDGYCKDEKLIFEFHGCFWHGCTKCYSPTTWNSVKCELMSTTYKKHQSRIKFLKMSIKDFKLIEIWECEYEKLKIEDVDLKDFLKNQCNISERLNPRDSLFGGRVNSLKLFHTCGLNEKIKYCDFTSLYPYVQKYKRYPIGHPSIITENFEDIKNYFGIIKCRILPPKSLYIPVLPLKMNTKLIFGLCRTCASLKSATCYHNDDDRALEGTWITLEVEKAVEKGYKILQIFEVWHYEKSEVYDESSKSGGLFTKYVDLFLKYKQEASGFPENVKTREQKMKYIEDYYQKEGIKLDIDNIKHNVGLRSVMKLLLNSFWGRFGMQTNKTQVKFISKLDEWYKMLTDNQYIIQDVDFGIPNILTVYFYYEKDFDEGSIDVNVCIASFVTCHARLKLYEELEKLNERVLYFDTDSIIYISKPNMYEPCLGEYLGELTNEISPKDGNYITEFISAGPKNYAYKLDTGLSKCTIKGFSLNYISNLKLNFDSIKEIVLNDHTKKLKINQLKFTRDITNWEITTSVIEKLYSFVYDKRVIIENYETLPYGY